MIEADGGRDLRNKAGHQRPVFEVRECGGNNVSVCERVRV